MVNRDLKELKEELDWLENTPFYIGRDGLPSAGLILFIMFTGIVFGIMGIFIYKQFKKKSIKEKIKELEDNEYH